MAKCCYHTLLFISFSVFQLVRRDGKELLPYFIVHFFLCVSVGEM